MGKSTPQERLEQLKKILHDDEVQEKDKLRYAYHSLMLEIAFWRRSKADKFVEKHGTKLNEVIDIVMFVKKLDDL
jgi:hypothetical protein